MAVYTKLNQSKIEKILSNYKLGNVSSVGAVAKKSVDL